MDLLEKLQRQGELNSGSPENAPSCFLGFDGFTDEIVAPVKERQGSDHLTFFPTIGSFGKQIVDSSDKSCNIELITRQTKLGGNAPIMANALLEFGYPLVLAGTIGEPDAIEPLFQTLADRCHKAFPLGKSGYSEAIEFQDGKIILGKLDSLISLDYARILERIGKEALTSYLDSCSLFASTNWTMLPHMTSIWKNILRDSVPHLSKAKRLFFVDLADPAKRSDNDLIEALTLLSEFNPAFTVILGLNISEAHRVAKVLDVDAETPELMAQGIQKKLNIDQVLIHHKLFAVAADSHTRVHQKAFYTKTPSLTTGAGDNFNAGYCSGLLAGASMQEALLCGVATAGFYVRYGKSPTMSELAAFLHSGAT